MIIGIGTDLLEIERIAQILQSSSGERFAAKILTKREREYAGHKLHRLAEFVAGRFAAKEAVSKAFGCGISKELGFHDMEVIPDERGRPICRVSDRSFRELGLDPADTIVHLSISHSDKTAAAYAIVERRAGL